MPLGLQAITPKAALIDTHAAEAQLLATHRAYITAVQKQMQSYPSQKATKYRRTGDYGRSWGGSGSVFISAAESRLVNRLWYSVYVGGPRPGNGVGERQAAVMAGKGWPSISTVARATIKLYRPLYNNAVKGRAGVSLGGI